MKLIKILLFAFFLIILNPSKTVYADITVPSDATPGWLLQDGYYYWVEEDHSIATGQWKKVYEDYYYFDELGRMLSGKHNVNGTNYFFRENNGGQMLKGWIHTQDDLWYYANDSGSLATSVWLYLYSDYYYFDHDSVMQKGWIRYNGKNYYLNTSGQMQKGWLFSDGHYQYLDNNGAQQYGWQLINGKYYYLGDDGNMRTGWINLNGHYYYLNASGEMLTGWQLINGQWYFLSQGGNMCSGWLSYNNHWYYLGAPNDGSMKTGWQNINGYDYYLKADGIMAENGWLFENGIWKHFAYGGRKDREQSNVPTLMDDHGYYVSPMKTGTFNSSSERIEAMIARAYEYMGTPYRPCYSTYPGGAIDCSGLVMQALFAAGFDPSPAVPSHHALPQNEYDSRTLWSQTPMLHVPVSSLRRGDLVFYSSGPYAPIFHVAIYLGNDWVIEAWPPYVTDQYRLTDYPHPYILGVARPFA